MSPTPSPSDAQAGAYGVTLTLDRGYRFEVDSELPGVNPFVIDEGLPLGEASGPNPARVLLAAMASCLGASLLFCLGKSRIQVHGLRINASGTTVRNAEGRLRVGPCSITLHPDVAVNDRPRMQRCVELFEDFCIVTASVRQGIPVSVQVESTDAAE